MDDDAALARAAIHQTLAELVKSDAASVEVDGGLIACRQRDDVRPIEARQPTGGARFFHRDARLNHKATAEEKIHQQKQDRIQQGRDVEPGTLPRQMAFELHR